MTLENIRPEVQSFLQGGSPRMVIGGERVAAAWEDVHRLKPSMAAFWPKFP